MKRFILISALLAFVGNSDAYEFSTHAEMTKRAWNRMIGLDENKTLLVTLGIIKPTAPIFSGTRYFDISGSIIRERSIQTWDRHQMEDRGVPFATLPG